MKRISKQLGKDEAKTVDQIVAEFECNKDCSFVDFSLNIKPLLDEKYRNRSQIESFNEIVNGNQSQ